MTDKPARRKSTIRNLDAAVAGPKLGGPSNPAEALTKVLDAKVLRDLEALRVNPAASKMQRDLESITKAVDVGMLPVASKMIRELESVDRQTAFGAIGKLANVNKDLIDAASRAAEARVAAVPRMPEITLGPSPEVRALVEIQEDMAELRAITATQATNVALQAELAKRQGDQLDELITTITRSAKAAERLELAALVLGVIVVIPYFVGFAGWVVSDLVPWVQTTVQTMRGG
jgi:hypothetical protein